MTDKTELRSQIMGAVKVAQQKQTLEAIAQETDAIMELINEAQLAELQSILITISHKIADKIFELK